MDLSFHYHCCSRLLDDHCGQVCGSVETHVANGASLDYFADITDVSRVSRVVNVANVACVRSFLLVSLSSCHDTLQTHRNHDPANHGHSSLGHPLL